MSSPLSITVLSRTWVGSLVVGSSAGGTYSFGTPSTPLPWHLPTCVGVSPVSGTLGRPS